ncbi:uncharacterized protein LAESUDRAFT_712679 [Laetiporus sulphureus 93-53]|uniref:Uncharacterized protein n=1 Tax=Laetiporus sulphureus 93-53 TaxID=1314785 RepID=A0A165F869_9APHY|nr:uncharacterized protein LAESUDRAFT_712679 [Laetiporus sulphureus 93-53]KZT08574.1 hypothetical protein LAESUDRAFT_712679 [Laetiporus sulphureus 93-53]
MPRTTASDDGSSHYSPTSAVSTPAWAPPRTPLTPHKLAKLANALGVSTPLPAISYSATLTTSPLVPASSLSPSSSDYLRRSPSPSAASVQSFASTASSTKYLLHVIPPAHLPHESDALDEPDLLLPPFGASGYHMQFRRGILVPVYSTLSSQLAAIAKEYALPSTVGLVLYLILTSGQPSSGCPDDGTEHDEPGPRISEDSWRRIWHRVVKAEKEDSLPAGPRPIGLGLAASSPAATSSLQDSSNSSLRPFLSPGKVDPPLSAISMTPTPSTASHSVFSSQSGIEPPESVSSVSDMEGHELILSGLHSPALIPILAKFEFDIDRQKASWYEPWLRSRKVNQAKRAASRLESRLRAQSRSEKSEDVGGEAEERSAPFDLELVTRMRETESVPAFLRELRADVADVHEEGYTQLEDEEEEEEEEEDHEETDPAAQLHVDAHGDPLADVFGNDVQTWSDLHSESQPHQFKRQTNRNVVDLALDGAAMSALPDDLESDENEECNDEAEVADLWRRHSRPQLVVSIPSSPVPDKRRSSTTTTGTVKRHPPPPLDLAPSMPSSEGIAVQGSPFAPSRPGSMAFVDDAVPARSIEELTEDVHEPSVEHVQDVEQEGSTIESPELEQGEEMSFDDLDLGLTVDEDNIEYDESDPYDRRRSQFIMKAQLDEIERNLVALSPRRLQLDAIDNPRRPSFSATLSPPPQWGASPKPIAKTNPSSPLQGDFTSLLAGALWPAVPYTALKMNGHLPSESRSGSESRPPSPPRIAFNGITTEPPQGALPTRSRSGTVSNETLARQHDDDLYPPLIPPSLLTIHRNSLDSPIIPLSPDPFGRYPSEAEASRLHEEERQSRMHQEGSQAANPSSSRPPPPRKVSVGAYDQFDPNDRQNAQTPSSRFSIDSVASDDTKPMKGSSLVSMKNIKRLWRKTNSKLSISRPATPISESGRSSPNWPTFHDQTTSRRTSRSVSKSPRPFEYGSSSDSAQSQPKPRRKSSMQFIQDARNALVPNRTPPMDGPRQSSPALPPLPPSAAPSPSASPQFPSASPSPRLPDTKQGSIRKSILKSMKGSSSGSSIELLGDGQVRRRRPSIMDGSIFSPGSMKHASAASLSAALADIPPSPALPEFAASQNVLRHQSSQSNILNGNNNNGGGRRGSQRLRMSPSLSSASISTAGSSSGGQLTPGMSPPRLGGGALKQRRSGSSSSSSIESRPSVDVSQFEIVSPKLGAGMGPVPLPGTPVMAVPFQFRALDQSMATMR